MEQQVLRALAHQTVGLVSVCKCFSFNNAAISRYAGLQTCKLGAAASDGPLATYH